MSDLSYQAGLWHAVTAAPPTQLTVSKVFPWTGFLTVCKMKWSQCTPLTYCIYLIPFSEVLDIQATLHDDP